MDDDAQPMNSSSATDVIDDESDGWTDMTTSDEEDNNWNDMSSSVDDNQENEGMETRGPSCDDGNQRDASNSSHPDDAKREFVRNLLNGGLHSSSILLIAEDYGLTEFLPPEEELLMLPRDLEEKREEAAIEKFVAERRHCHVAYKRLENELKEKWLKRKQALKKQAQPLVTIDCTPIVSTDVAAARDGTQNQQVHLLSKRTSCGAGGLQDCGDDFHTDPFDMMNVYDQSKRNEKDVDEYEAEEELLEGLWNETGQWFALAQMLDPKDYCRVSLSATAAANVSDHQRWVDIPISIFESEAARAEKHYYQVLWYTLLLRLERNDSRTDTLALWEEQWACSPDRAEPGRIKFPRDYWVKRYEQILSYIRCNCTCMISVALTSRKVLY